MFFSSSWESDFNADPGFVVSTAFKWISNKIYPVYQKFLKIDTFFINFSIFMEP